MIPLVGVVAILIAMAGLVVADLIEHRRMDEPQSADYCVWCSGLIADRGCPACEREYARRHRC